jgi:hypothetical protein
MRTISASLEKVPDRRAAEIHPTRRRSATMKKLTVLLSAIGFATAASLVNASEDGLDLMPKVEGVEITHYVRDAGASAVKSNDEFYARGTGGISPQ